MKITETRMKQEVCKGVIASGMDWMSSDSASANSTKVAC